VRAAHAGTVSDVWVHPGQRVGAGDRLVSLLEGPGAFVMMAVLPGRALPFLNQGLPARLSIDGVDQAYDDVSLDSISEEVIGPTALRGLLGPEHADLMASEGPGVVVKGRLGAAGFLFAGQRFRFGAGMTGRVRIRLRSQRLIYALLPSLKNVTRLAP
jgi:hypothetical protein